MTGQLDIFAITHSRARDPETSHQAASQAHSLAKSQCALIHAWLIGHPGSHIEEIAKGTKLEKHAVTKRLPDLHADNLAYPLPEEFARKMSNGRRGRVWMAAKKS